MKAAILGDIHGNFPALEACVTDALHRGAEGFVFLGDYVSDFAGPRQTMDMLYSLRDRYPCWFVRGNREGYLLNCRAGEQQFKPGSKSGSLYFTYRNLREADLDFFSGLPIYQKTEIGGFSVELAHAERKTDRHVFEPGDSYLSQVFRDMDTSCLLTAHAHCQYLAREGGKTIVNPGTVGYPGKTPGTACYALGDFTPEGAAFTLLQIPYDAAQTVDAQFASGLVDEANYWALGVLNNLITGKDEILRLLQAVRRRAGEQDETVWAQEARKLGLALTREELLARWEKLYHKGNCILEEEKHGC